ncbi:MAG: DnaA regulatory inactivator Hda [Zoogloeaceae bacterium]|nr:DnaA regulatory inactivator Hda [Zoogloeaceae bacterium]
MKQLVLDIRLDAPPSLDNFIAEANRPAVTALGEAAVRSGLHVYLWGSTGSGKTHLLRATASAAEASGRPAQYLRAADSEEFTAPPGAVQTVDDVQNLTESGQVGLFNAFNRAGVAGHTLILSGSAAPLGLQLREDLRTRIGQCLIFHLQPLDDVARAAIIASQATRRGLRLEESVVSYLLRYGRRDLPSLLSVLDALDAASLEHKRPITLPLLRQIMQAGLDI